MSARVPYSQKFLPGEKLSPIFPPALVGEIFIHEFFCPMVMITWGYGDLYRIGKIFSLQYKGSWPWRNICPVKIFNYMVILCTLDVRYPNNRTYVKIHSMNHRINDDTYLLRNTFAVPWVQVIGKFPPEDVLKFMEAILNHQDIAIYGFYPRTSLIYPHNPSRLC